MHDSLCCPVRRWGAFAVTSACCLAITACATYQTRLLSAASPPAPIPAAEVEAEATLYLMGDNQERELFGQESTYSEIIAHKLSSVAIRSIEQDLFSKFLVQYAVDEITTAVQVGTQPPTILHLGDLLDYSCASEFEKVSRQPWASYPQLFIAPGNHDVIFQGNASYLSDLGEALLRLKKIVNPAIDPTLAGHHNAVCRTQNRPIAYIPPEVLAMKQ